MTQPGDEIPRSVPCTPEAAAQPATSPFAGPEATTAEEAPRQAAGMPNVPGYAIEGVLGRGGMGVVYRATHLALKRTVALKMILAGGHAGEQARARFRAEAEAVARLQHPGIVQVYEIGEIDGLPFYALEFVAGGTLAELVARQKLAPNDAAALVEKLALAMHAAHSRQVIHRDLKPANILLAVSGVSEKRLSGRRFGETPLNDAVPKITDFGLAKQLDADGQTRTGEVLGTPSYMAPEQARGTRDVGPWSDIHALGAILYNLLTGRPPFLGDTAVATLEQVRNQEPAAPRRLNRAVPADLETICLKCLEKEPARRYATAAALAEDLRRFREGEAILARPAGRTERLLKWAWRRPTQAAAVALAILAMILGGLGAGAAVLWLRAEDARARLKIANAQLAQDRDLAERRGYFDSVRLAHREALEVHEIDRARELLDECPPQLREWEWHYVRSLCRGSDRVLRGLNEPADRLSFSPDGRRLVSNSHTGNVIIWDLTGGQIERKLPLAEDSYPRLTFTADGRLVMISKKGYHPSIETTLRIWDIKGKELFTRPFGTDVVTGLAVTPNAKRMATWRVGQSVQLWNMDTWQVERTLSAVRGTFGAAFSADGRQMAVAQYNVPGPRIWDLEKELPPRALSGTGIPAHGLAAVAFSSDGGYLAGLAVDQSIWGWDLSRAGPPQELAPRGASGCQSITFRPGTRDLLFARGRQVVQRNGDGAVRYFEGHTRLVQAVAASPDGKLAASAGADKTIRLWDLNAPWRLPGGVRRLFGKPLESGNRPALIDSVYYPERVFYLGDGSRVGIAGQKATHGTEATVWVCDRAGKILHTHRQKVVQPGSMTFSPDLARIAILDTPTRVRFRDAATGKPLAPDLAEAGHRLTMLLFSPDGRLLAGHGEGRVTFWDASTGRIAHTLDSIPLPAKQLYGPENRLIFSPDSTAVACAPAKSVVVRNIATGEVLHRLEGHTDEVHALAFSRDGRVLATASEDRTIRLWDMQTGELLRLLRGHVEGVFDVAFSENGRRLASGGADGSLRVWDVDTGQEALPVASSETRMPPRSLNFDATGRLTWVWDNNLEAIDPSPGER